MKSKNTDSSKTNTFSVYLLKKNFTAANMTDALKEKHGLIKAQTQKCFPEKSIIYLSDNNPEDPWWIEYWGIQENIKQSLKGAIVFLPIDNRCFAITFGHAYHKLKDTSFEYNFGLMTSLNALDPDKIKSSNTANPENAMQYRVQSPSLETLTDLNFLKDNNIIKKLEGLALEKHSDLFKNISGSHSFRFSSNKKADGLKELCKSLLEIYTNQDIKKKFPEIFNILPVKDPDIINNLNEKLVEEFKKKTENLLLTIPEISKHLVTNYKYSSARKTKYYQNIDIDDYEQYLVDKNISDINISTFKKHHVFLLNDDNDIETKFSIYRCIVFDCEFNNIHYHLFDGDWFEVNNNYIENLKKELDPIFINNDKLFACEYRREDEYTKSVSDKNSLLLLDQHYISPQNNKREFEACDLLDFIDNKINLIHIKPYTSSATLSHLFNQGINSLTVLKTESKSRKRLIGHITEKITSDNDLLQNYIQAINKTDFKLIFGIIVPAKKINLKSDALPLFSRMSLKSALKDCKFSQTECDVVLIENKFNGT